MTNHYRRTIHKYRGRQKAPGCPFCNPETIAKAVLTNDQLYIVPNLTQYDLWELHDVVDHLLIIPRRHIKHLAELNQEERLAVMGVCAKYEAEGYSVYARGSGFVKRSVEHQHTHLIKTTNKQPRLSFFLQKPYYLFKA